MRSDRQDAGWGAPLPRMSLDALMARRRRLSLGDPALRDQVSAIVARVATEGDRALVALTQDYDRVDVDPKTWWLDPDVCEAAFRKASATLREDLLEVRGRIRAYEEAFAGNPPDRLLTDASGFALGLLERPVGRAACYVPAGTAPLVSSVLMGALVARQAGVPEVIVATPPRMQGISPAILAACHVAGVSRVLTLGGAQAIAALALGTESIPQQDVIAGPGNRYVTEAKRQVYGLVGLDGVAGPSEVLVVADEAADPGLAAADLLAQAEHDVDAIPILVSIGEAVGQKVLTELATQVASLPRREIALRALAGGAWVVAESVEEALAVAAAVAPEHLELMVQEASDAKARPSLMARLGPAGAVFLGNVAEALGDYVAGPSHVLPTAGAARFSSPLGRRTFLRRTSVLARDLDSPAGSGFETLLACAARLARVEGLEAHARAAEARGRALPAAGSAGGEDRAELPAGLSRSDVAVGAD